MKKQYVLILICCITMGFTYAQEQLNLEEAIELTIANNPQIKQGKSSKVAAEASVEKAKANYYPKLTANAGYTHIDPTGFVQFGASQLSFIPNDNYNLNLGLQFNIYDFGRTNVGVRLAKNNINLSENELQLTKQELAFATIQVYYQIHFLKEAIKVQNRQIDALDLALDQTKKLQENGEATNYEILTTKVKLSNANNVKDDLQTALSNALISLEQLTGKETINPDSLVNNWLSVENPDSLTANIDVTTRPEFKLAEIQSENATLQEMLAKRNFNPLLSANVQGGYKNAIAPDIYQLQLNYVASAQLTIPIFTGFKNRAAVKEAQAMNNAAEFNLENTSKQLVTEVKQAIKNLNNAFQKIERSNLQVEQAQKAAELARLKYKNQVITNLDLLDTEIALSEAEINKLNTVFNYTMNTYKLKKTMGINLY